SSQRRSPPPPPPPSRLLHNFRRPRLLFTSPPPTVAMDDRHLRQSAMSTDGDDVRQDRQMIMRKIQARRRTQLEQKKSERDAAAAEEGDAGGDVGGDAPGGRTGRRASVEMRGMGSYEGSYDEDVPEEDDDAAMAAAILQHHRDESERALAGAGGPEEGLEAMNHALTSPPVAWWAMRKQWQKRRMGAEAMGARVGGFAAGLAARVGGGGTIVSGRVAGGDEDYEAVGPDASYRSAASEYLASGAPDASGVVGHPVMLEDPSAAGFDASAFRRNPLTGGDRRRRAPTVLVVPRHVLQKRKAQQTAYIVAAICAVFLFMFVLEQRKLSHYAMVESPMSLSAYLAGEKLAKDGGKKVTLGDLGLEEFEGAQGVPQVEFNVNTDPDQGDDNAVEVNPNDPRANPELANDPMVGDHPKATMHEDEFSKIHGDDRFELLKGVVVGWGVSPVEAFQTLHTPQSRALSWMAHEDVLRYNPTNDHWIKKIVQRYALAVTYYSTNGPGWRHTLHFLSNLDECDWNRKYAGYFTGAGHCEGGFVTVLALWGNNLGGALPPEVGAFTSLRTLSIFDNKIEVAPPASIAKLTMLTRLYVQRNRFRSVSINYLCPTPARDFKADCGRKGGVECECCTGCGYNAKNDRANMIDASN
ncbi:hypothetical protein ACHAWF_007851, partial [Thalassiosira exigua]